MAASHLFRLGKVKGENGILVALKHNKRTLQMEVRASPHIQIHRTVLNYSLVNEDTPESIARLAKSKMILAGVDRCRKDQVRAVEIIFSLPNDRHEQDTKAFFKDCYQWVLDSFKGELLAFDVHLDESAPHAHAIILPLVNGKMQGSDMVGGIGNMYRLRNSFHANVARHYGLSSVKSSKLSAMDKELLERLVLEKLKSDTAMHSSVWSCIRDEIHKDPLPYAEMLSIQLPNESKITKSFVDIARSEGKGSFVR